MYKCIDNKWKKTSRKKEYRESCEESRKSTNKSEGAALAAARAGLKGGTIIWFLPPPGVLNLRKLQTIDL